jgi:phospholipid-binding lipoprotein MlaA
MLSRFSPSGAAALRQPRLARALAAASLSVLATGCATGPQANPQDPLEPMNRVIFKVNDTIDTYGAQPLAKGYKAVTPEPARLAVTNFFSNLSDVGNFVNNVLQGKGVDATETMMRIAINSVLGIGGLIDVATAAGLNRHSQDFGLTLGTWGVPAGPYLVLPIYGPSSFRDSMGVAASIYLDPAHYLDPAWRNSLFGVNVINTRSNLLGATDLLSQAALDKYAFVRDAYSQRRQYLLNQGENALPSYDEVDESDKASEAKPAAAGEAAPAKPALERLIQPATPATPATRLPRCPAIRFSKVARIRIASRGNRDACPLHRPLKGISMAAGSLSGGERQGVCPTTTQNCPRRDTTRAGKRGCGVRGTQIVGNFRKCDCQQLCRPAFRTRGRAGATRWRTSCPCQLHWQPSPGRRGAPPRSSQIQAPGRCQTAHRRHARALG